MTYSTCGQENMSETGYLVIKSPLFFSTTQSTSNELYKPWYYY